MNKDEYVQMRIFAPDFKMPCELDDRYSYIEISEYSHEKDLLEIIDSINETLSDWKDRPDIDNLKKDLMLGVLVLFNILKEK